MKIENKEKYTLISSDENSFQDFYKLFHEQKLAFEEEHVILQLSDSFNTKNNEISLFLDYSNKKRTNGTSFVVVDKNVIIDDFPEDFNIAPTLQEAEDILDMENMERELGF